MIINNVMSRQFWSLIWKGLVFGILVILAFLLFCLFWCLLFVMLFVICYMVFVMPLQNKSRGKVEQIGLICASGKFSSTKKWISCHIFANTIGIIGMISHQFLAQMCPYNRWSIPVSLKKGKKCPKNEAYLGKNRP